ncbi:hypothetical protein bsdcttw_07530 [Anaerocolumna chitinilytica]|uniref:Uncharacterized protein n=1 Tax=Anaerocolumna chitinilytica TaxID=1727145 RepID=A0A7I8DH87_9FIRM|nr:hypothetical protein bsdcttw_07530 [Anaerocolumna chitinilytica]
MRSISYTQPETYLNQDVEKHPPVYFSINIILPIIWLKIKYIYIIKIYDIEKAAVMTRLNYTIFERTVLHIP